MILVELNPVKEESLSLAEQVEQIRNELSDLKKDLRESKVYTAASRIDDLWDALEDLEKSVVRKGPEAKPKQKDQGDVLRLLLASNNGKMLLNDARNKLGLSKSQFSQLLSTMKEEVDTRPTRTNKRSKILMLKNGLNKL